MSPHRTLTILVVLAAATIAVMWFVLFRNHVLAPPLVLPQGPSFSDVGKQLDASIERLQKITEQATNAPVNAGSDEVRVPAR